MTLKGGMTVRFRDDLVVGNMYGGITCTPGMAVYATRTDTVAGHAGANFMVASSRLVFTTDMLAPETSVTDFPEDKPIKVEVNF